MYRHGCAQTGGCRKGVAAESAHVLRCRKTKTTLPQSQFSLTANSTVTLSRNKGPSSWRRAALRRMTSVTSGLNTKTECSPRPNLQPAISGEAHLFFCFCSCNYDQMAPQHALMLQLDNQNFNVLILSSGSFLSHCPPVGARYNKQWPTTRSQLIN